MSRKKTKRRRSNKRRRKNNNKSSILEFVHEENQQLKIDSARRETQMPQPKIYETIEISDDDCDNPVKNNEKEENTRINIFGTNNRRGNDNGINNKDSSIIIDNARTLGESTNTGNALIVIDDTDDLQNTGDEDGNDSVMIISNENSLVDIESKWNLTQPNCTTRQSKQKWFKRRFQYKHRRRNNMRDENGNQSNSNLQNLSSNYKATISTNIIPYKKRAIVIDGSNVAFSHSLNTKFSLRGLDICIEYFLKLGHEVKAVLPLFRSRSHNLDEMKILTSLKRRKLIIYSPCKKLNGKIIKSYDDRIILDIAHVLNAAVISNDNYEDIYFEEEKYKNIISTRVITYTWCGDLFILPRDPYGKTGPLLSEILNTSL